MTPRATTATPAPAPRVDPDQGSGGIGGIIRAVIAELRTDAIATFLFLAALVIGFAHGWLKIRYPSTVMTFAFDIPVVACLVVVLATLPRGTKVFPDCGVSQAVKFLLGAAAVWSILPFDVPWLAALASYRAWCFSPLLFLLGYHLFKTVRKVELVMWTVLLLGLVTAVYGIFFQSEAEVRELMKSSAMLEQRLQGTFYATSSGAAEFRRFSTFVSAAVFGVTMAACAQFSAARFFQPGCSLLERAILVTITGLCSYAVIISGSRTSLALLVASLLLTAFVRRGKLQWILLPAIGGGALYIGILATKSNAAERFGTLLDPTTVIGRVLIVLGPTAESLLTSPLGFGVGASGYGVPGVLAARVAELRIERGAAAPPQADGDLGRLAIDLGLVGIIVYGYMIFQCARDSLRWMWKLRDSPLGVIGVPAGAWFFMSLVQIPTGSPYLGIPFGPMTWILLGALRRMIDEYERLEKQYGSDVDTLPMFASFIRAPRMSSLFGTRAAPAGGPMPAMDDVVALSARPSLVARRRQAVTTADGKPAKRFLFWKEDGSRR